MLTPEALIERSGQLSVAALQHTNAILLPGMFLSGTGVNAVCTYLQHMFRTDLYNHFFDYALAVLGRQLTAPVAEGTFFVPTPSDLQEGDRLLQQPNSITLWVYYLLPLTVFGLAYHWHFPAFFPCDECPDRFFQGFEDVTPRDAAYAAVRLDHSVRVMQIRFGLLRNLLLDLDRSGNSQEASCHAS